MRYQMMTAIVIVFPAMFCAGGCAGVKISGSATYSVGTSSVTIFANR